MRQVIGFIFASALFIAQGFAAVLLIAGGFFVFLGVALLWADLVSPTLQRKKA